MGFLDGLGKMIKGEPLFDSSDEELKDDDTFRQPEDNLQEVAHPLVDDAGRKVIPHVTVEHCKTHRRGATVEVTAWLTNSSDLEIELDKIQLLNNKSELNRRLHAQEGHEALLYRGPVITTDSLHKAELLYRIIQNDDYFKAEFMIEYNHESDGTFTVEDLHPEHAIRDI